MVDTRPDREAFVGEHYPYVYGTAYSFAGNEPDALDLTQETFANALRVLASGGTIDNPRAYLVTALKNLFFRSKKKQGHEAASVEDVDIFIEDHQEEPLPDPDTIDSDDVQRALRRLPEEFRVPVVLYYYNEYSYEKIAEELDVPIGTVMSRLSRAKRYLKLALARSGRE